MILNGKAALAECFNVSVNSVTNWLLRGCPVLEAEGKHQYRFYIPEVIGWLGLGGPADNDEPAELSLERARLAKAQTTKTTVETRLKEAQLGHVLAGGVIPADKARDLIQHGMVLVMQTIGNMVVSVPLQFLEGDHLREELAHNPIRRLRLLMDAYRLDAGAEFRRAGEALLARYLGDPGQVDDETPDDAA